MAKKTLEELLAIRDATYAVYTKALDTYSKANDEYRAAFMAKQNSEAWGIEECLPAYINHYENTRGFDMLRTMLPGIGKHARGFYYGGSHYTDTNQNSMTVSIPADATDEYLDTVAMHIEAILPFILPEENGYRRFSIMEHSLSMGGSIGLYEKDDAWIVGSDRSIKYGYSTKKPDSLIDTLKFIRSVHWMD